MSRIIATYVGDAGQPSMGFVPSKEYVLTITVEDKRTSWLVVRNVEAPHQSCPYGSLSRLLDFWTNLRKVGVGFLVTSPASDGDGEQCAAD